MKKVVGGPYDMYGGRIPAERTGVVGDPYRWAARGKEKSGGRSPRVGGNTEGRGLVGDPKSGINMNP